jgi:hypothetical protein
VSQSTSDGYVLITLTDTNPVPEGYMNLVLMTTSLIGYTGGPICTLPQSNCLSPSGVFVSTTVVNQNFSDPLYGVYIPTSGALTPIGVPGPTIGSGPSGVMLAGGGLLVWWRARRKAAKSHSGALAGLRDRPT